MKLWVVGTNALLLEFPEAFRAKIKKHEDDGTTDSDEYKELIDQFNKKHLCTVIPWPDDLGKAFAAMNSTIYSTMHLFRVLSLPSRANQ